MSNYQYLTCQEWDEKLAETDPEMLTDEELDAYNLHVSTCSRCASLISNSKSNTFIRENIPLEEIMATIPEKKCEARAMRRTLRRSIFIGLGKTGNEIVSHVSHEFKRPNFATSLFQYCIIDADEKSSSPSFNQDNQAYLNIGNTVFDRGLQDAQMRDAIAEWWGNRDINYVKIDESTGQMRAIGRVQLFTHFDEIYNILQYIVNATACNVKSSQIAEQGFEMLDDPPIVYLIFSPGDVIGGGLFLDIAYLVQELFKPHVSPEIVALAVLPGSKQTLAESHTRLQANTYAALQELEHYTKAASTWEVSYPSSIRISSTASPFSSVYLVDTANEKGETYSFEDVYKQVERFLFCLSIPEVSTSPQQTLMYESDSTIVSRIVHSRCVKDVEDDRHEPIDHLPMFSSFGVSHARLDWQMERIRSQVKMLFYNHFLYQKPVSSSLPGFLRSVTALNSTFEKELPFLRSVTTIKSAFEKELPFFEDSNSSYDKLILKGKITHSSVLEEIQVLKKKYDDRLLPVRDDEQWRSVETKYVEQARSSISTFIHITLQEHGPVAAQRALEEMYAHLEKLHKEIKELHQDQYGQKCDAERWVNDNCKKWRIESEKPCDSQNGSRLCEKRRFIGDGQKKDITDNLYKLYIATLLEIYCTHIIDALLTPISGIVKQQKQVFANTKDKLDELYGKSIERDMEQEEQDENSARHSQPSVQLVKPYRKELEHLKKAISSGKLPVEALSQEISQNIYEMWPFEDNDGDGMMRLEHHIDAVVTQLLTDFGKQEHLAYRLHSYDSASVRQRFIASSACMINFTETAKRQLFMLNNLHMLNYGFAPSQAARRLDIEITLGKFADDLSGHPHLRQVDSEHELTLLNVVHGFSLSSLRILDEFHRAYEFVIRTAHAPYLHLYDMQQGITRSVFTREPFTLEQLRETWEALLANVRLRTMLLVDLEDIFEPLERYYTFIGSCTKFMKIDRPDHPFFDVLATLKKMITPQLNQLAVETLQTSEVKQILTTLADMEAMLFSQGWHKIDPPQYTLFNPQLHHRHLEDDTVLPVNKKARIIDVENPGYIHYNSDDAHNTHRFSTPVVRRAEVIISSWSDDNQERPVSAEQTI